MKLNEIVSTQKEFSAKHGWIWETKTDKELLERLNYGTIALLGECGEFANIVKKVQRDPALLNEKLSHLREELTDILIYTFLLSISLKADLQKEWEMKMQKNEKRFKKFRQTETVNE